MWEDRKYSRDSHPHHSQRDNSRDSGYGNAAYDPTEDLHAWSIYRQNLNADLSESAIGIGNKSSEKPFGNFQLKESTVNNILSHPKYGPSIKSHDPYTYLRFGLPRVKANGVTGAQSELGGRQLSSLQPHHPHHHQGLTSDSASVSGEESPFVRRRGENFRPNGLHANNNNNNNKRIWKSNPDLLGRGDIAESNFMSTANHSHPNGVKSVIGVNGNLNRPTSRSSRVKSEMDLRSPPNNYTPGFKSNAPSQLNGANSVMNGGSRSGHHPHLIVRNLYYEVDRTSTVRRICGAQRQKLRVLDNVSFEVKSGEIMAIMATNGKT